MKKILPILFLVVVAKTTSAQYIYELMERTDLSLREVEIRANRYFDSAGTGRGTGYKHFQRWLFERKFHVDENGMFITPLAEWNNFLQARSAMTQLTQAANWVPLGPTGWSHTSGWNPGTGRLTSLAIHPSNESTIYVGSPGGGIWKTTNAGINWQPLVDNNSLLMTIYALAIDPANQNIVYAGSGTGIGIVKSTDAGATWSPTGGGPAGLVRKILIHPSSPNTVFACANNGIFRSVNGGTTWTQVHSGLKEDIEFKPGDINIMYASGSDVVRSIDNGQTWNPVGVAQGITNTGRTLVAVSAANPDIVYAVQASGSLFGRLYKSIDAGLNFTTTIVGNPAIGTNFFGYEASGTGTSGQATYDMALDIAPTNADDVYIAGIIVWRSINGGTSFTALTEWFYPNARGYNHADVHGLEWVNSTLYSISDGGIYKSMDNGDNWTDLSTGLGIRQFYRIANSQTNPNVITGGAQDNGSAARQASGNWVDWLGADGMEGLVSPTDHLKLWGTSQNGSLYRSINGGNTYTNLPRPSAGQWVTPLVIHPTNESILYGGWTGVYKSINGGSSWTNISAGSITGTLADLAIAPSNPNYIYASNGLNLWVTTDDGATWTTRSAPAVINDIAVDPGDPSKIWIACNSSVNRILVSTNAGASFTNISGNLPSIVARTIAVDDNNPRGIYIGMNTGVYFKEETASNWSPYLDNLPLVAINELEIQKAAGKIRVATYGRGVWESPVATNCALNSPIADFTANIVTVCTGQSVAYTNTSTNCQSTFAWTFAGGSPGTSTAFNPVITYNTPGNYAVSLTVTNPGGTNTKTINGYITVSTVLSHSISISTPKTDICANESATFTLSSTNGGASPAINWFKNGVAIAGTGGQTAVTLSNLSNNDIIAANQITSQGCASPVAAVSNNISMIVLPNLVHSASISTPKTQLCAGDPATFTLFNSNPGTTPTIQWYRNNIPIPGTSGSTAITLSSLLDGDIISASEISNARCVSPVSATTNSIGFTVTPRPRKPVITRNVGDLFSSVASGNLWFRNNADINGATGQQFRPIMNGTYQVQSTVNGCAGPMSDPFELVIEGTNLLYPVPTQDGQVKFDFFVPVGNSNFVLTIYNNQGQLIYQRSGNTLPGLNRITYDGARLRAGIYRFHVLVGTTLHKKDMVVQ